MTVFLLHRVQQRLYQALPWAMICLVLSASAVASKLSLSLMLLAIGGLVALLGATILLPRPGLGIVALIPACLVVPLEIGTGTQTSLHGGILLVTGLLGLWLLETVTRKGQLHLLGSRGATTALLLLLCSATISFVVGQLSWFPVAPAPLRAQIGGLAVFVISGGAFLLTAYRIQDLRWLEWMVWIFLALGALYIAGRVIPGLGVLSSKLFQYSATGSLFWVWLASLAFSQALLNHRLHIGWRGALVALVGAMLYVAAVQGYDWKSGWLPLLASVAVILVVRWWRLGLLFSALGVMPALSLVSNAVATDEYSYATRLDAWLIMAEIVKKSPLLGLGPANYYWYTPLFPIRGYYVQFNSHSQYVDLVAQVGIIGLVCFLWFAWEVGWLGWRLRVRAPGGFVQAYVYGTLGGLVGTLVAGGLGDWVLPFVYNIGLSGMRASLLGWIFLGGLVAVERILLQPTAAHPDKEHDI